MMFFNTIYIHEVLHCQAHNLNTFRTKRFAEQVLYLFTCCCSDVSVGASSWVKWHHSHLAEVMNFC